MSARPLAVMSIAYNTAAVLQLRGVPGAGFAENGAARAAPAPAPDDNHADSPRKRRRGAAAPIPAATASHCDLTEEELPVWKEELLEPGMGGAALASANATDLT